MSNRIYRSCQEPIRENLSFDERLRGHDKGLILAWEVGRERSKKDTKLAEQAKNGELPKLGWKGGVEDKTKKGSSDFSVVEFKLRLTVETLCKAIIDDNCNISIQALTNTTDWLNELLQVPDLHDILHAKKPNSNFSKSANDLVDKTKDYRNKNFSNLNNDEQNTIKRLNRLLLEETYPRKTPKSPKKKVKYGCLNYLAEWQGLRGVDLDIDLSEEREIICSKTGVKVIYTGDVTKYVNQDLEVQSLEFCSR